MVGYPTEREQVLYTEPDGRGKRGSRLDSFLRNVEEERDYYRQEADNLRRMLRDRCSCSPCRRPLQSRSPTRQSPVKVKEWLSNINYKCK